MALLEIWTEKYRPKILDEMVGQKEVIERLKAFIQRGTIPHLLFAGPPGTGKTTAALCIARQLLGERWKDNFLELNASVSKNTPILVKINNKIKRITFEELDKIYFGNDTLKEYVKVNNLEVLTIDENYKVKWAKASAIIRHLTSKILRIYLEGGGILELTGNHSVIILNENGLEAIKASEIKEGDYLLSFVTKLEGNVSKIDLSGYKYEKVTSRTAVINTLELNKNNSCVLGLYTAEGAVGFKGHTSGQVVYTIGVKENSLAKQIRRFANQYGIKIYENFVGSGFDRKRLSARQIRILSTQLARFIKDYFYDGRGFRAKNKRIPHFTFSANLESRLAYLKGLYLGDGSGKWGNVVRISSISEDLLIDIAWLARISGIESSIFEKEVRLIWKGGMKWKKSDLLPAKPILSLLRKIKDKIRGNWRYELRHQLYEGCNRISKSTLRKIIKMIDESKLSENEKRILELLKKLAYTDLHALKIRKIEIIDYNDFVYDISVPNNEMFFAGSIPILLHNSDERGIQTIREKVKDFARTRSLGKVPFKIIFLDEADALTRDAQQALRRIMEKYSSTARFILSCNYSSKIIDPIQSRCAVFRFKPLTKSDIVEYLKRIVEGEKLKIEEGSLEAIAEIAMGDARRAVNILQAAAATKDIITKDLVYEVASVAKPEEMKEVLKLALEGNFIEARDKLIDIVLRYGMSGEDAIKQIVSHIWGLPVDAKKKIDLIDKAGEIEFRIIEGSDPHLQLETFLAYIAKLKE